MPGISSLLLSFLLTFTGKSSANSILALSLFIDEPIEFHLNYGPCNDHESSEKSHNVILKLSDVTLSYSRDKFTDNKSDIFECKFISANDKGYANIDKEASLTILYHNSGMNRDGTRRYFYHKWHDSIKSLF